MKYRICCHLYLCYYLINLYYTINIFALHPYSSSLFSSFIFIAIIYLYSKYLFNIIYNIAFYSCLHSRVFSTVRSIVHVKLPMIYIYIFFN
jgi:hypothetical protein